MRTKVESASRVVLDLLLKDASKSSVQQLLIEVALEIVVEQLETICYVTKDSEKDGESTTYVQIDESKNKDEYI